VLDPSTAATLCLLAMRSKLLFVIEFVVVAAIFYLDYVGILPVSKTPYLFLLGWISIRLRGLRWKDVGLRFGSIPDWRLTKLLLVGVAVGIVMEALELFATQPILTKLLSQGPDLHELHRLVGNTQLFILGIVLAWVLAAFGEEFVYRGYLLNRGADLFGRSTIGWVSSAVLITVLFGLAHFPQGPTGIIENIIDGGILAAVYFATNRNLLAPIIAHGIQDTVDVLLIYLGVYPGLRHEVALF
jgi:membrane protease YdiL (CAAX protease family)